MSGAPKLQIASFSASTQKAASWVLEMRQVKTLRLIGALSDRLTHRVNMLEMTDDSYRLGQSRAPRTRVIQLQHCRYLTPKAKASGQRQVP